MAQKALQTVDTDVSVPAGTPQDKLDAYKAGLRSQAYSTMGAVEYNKGNFPAAETNFQKAIDAYPSDPYALDVLRLALSLDKQQKYPEALKVANRAVDMTKESDQWERQRDASVTACSTLRPAPRPPRASLRRTDRGELRLRIAMKSREIMALEESLGHHFQRHELIEQALTHSSQARELQASGASHGLAGSGDNELLEFLGDAVLGLVTSEALFHRFPGFGEGQLSKLRAHLVGQRHLLRVAEQLRIGEYMRLGRGEERSGGRSKASLLVDALEAILAALYLDGGWTVARDFIIRVIVEP